MLIEPCPNCGKHEADKIKSTFPFGNEIWLYGCPEVPEGWLIPTGERFKPMICECPNCGNGDISNKGVCDNCGAKE